MTDGIPPSLSANDLRRIADALEELLDLKRKELAGEIRPHWMKPKPREKWVACRLEVVRVLEDQLLLCWDDAKDNAVLKNPDVGNIYQRNQWERFIDHHAVPNWPEDDGSGVSLVRLDRDGSPPALARKDSAHCARLRLAYPLRWDEQRQGSRDKSGMPESDPECEWCRKHGRRP